MRLTLNVEYALRAMLFLAGCDGHQATAREIARAQNIPPATLYRVLGWLTSGGLLQSRPSAKGGYRIAKDTARITLRQVIEAAEGPLFINTCLLHGMPCPQEREHWCPAHEVWEEAQNVFLHVLEQHSLNELAGRLQRWDSVNALLAHIAPSRK